MKGCSRRCRFWWDLEFSGSSVRSKRLVTFFAKAKYANCTLPVSARGKMSTRWIVDPDETNTRVFALRLYDLPNRNSLSFSGCRSSLHLHFNQMKRVKLLLLIERTFNYLLPCPSYTGCSSHRDRESKTWQILQKILFFFWHTKLCIVTIFFPENRSIKYLEPHPRCALTTLGETSEW